MYYFGANMDEDDVKGIFGNLDKFKAVKAKGNVRSSFEACCPAHDDSSPSLLISIAQDGRILLHCFSGCGVHEICDACNIHITDLFPSKIDHKPGRPINIPTEDRWYIAVIKGQIKKGEPVSDHDRRLYAKAVTREAGRGSY